MARSLTIQLPDQLLADVKKAAASTIERERIPPLRFALVNALAGLKAAANTVHLDRAIGLTVDLEDGLAALHDIVKERQRLIELVIDGIVPAPFVSSELQFGLKQISEANVWRSGQLGLVERDMNILNAARAERPPDGDVDLSVRPDAPELAARVRDCEAEVARVQRELDRYAKRQAELLQEAEAIEQEIASAQDKAVRAAVAD